MRNEDDRGGSTELDVYSFEGDVDEVEKVMTEPEADSGLKECTKLGRVDRRAFTKR